MLRLQHLADLHQRDNAMNSIIIFSSLFIFNVVPQSAASPVSPGIPDREMLKNLWDSIDTLEFDSEEYVVDDRGRPMVEKGHVRQQFSLASGGRRALKLDIIAADGTTHREEFREDGRRRYEIVPFHGHPNSIDTVVIKNQVNTDAVYSGATSRPMCLFTPGGKPLYLHLDEGGALEVEQAGVGSRHVVLKSRIKEYEAWFELDPQHDWVPRRVVLGTGKERAEWIATRFTLENGRWFPTEGLETLRSGDREIRWSFRVTNLRINRPIPTATFSAPSLPRGVALADRTKNQIRVEGGRAARELLAAKYLPPPTQAPPHRSQPIIAARSPTRFPWSAVLAAGAGVTLLIAALVMKRSSRR